ncbi:hypothetical protein GCM10023321_38950 [Pseudonocardia eucalypti]|uniref:Glycerophosphoryl diester phosphodiesterase membrane domain-containing protein n=1 Tax=Pseudonocardia eucalypti TaxID=648755 RepID=A0ABP9Q979_9PSEU|nr:hypothetical protein [Pseudonocardia eucalypti]
MSTPPPDTFPPYPGPPAQPGPGAGPYPAYPPPWTPLPGDPLIPVDLGGWLDRSIQLIRRSFWPLTLIALIALGAIVVAAGVIAGVTLAVVQGVPNLPEALVTVPIGVGALVTIGVFAVGQGAMVGVAVTDAAGRRMDIGEALRLGARRALPLTGWWALGALAIAVGAVLLIVPGMYLGVVLGASLTCVVVIERAGIGRCFELVKDRFWATFGRLVLAWLLQQAYQLVAQLVLMIPLGIGFGLIGLGNAGTSPGALGFVLFALAGVLLLAVMIPMPVISTAMTVVTYAELRGRQQPGATAGLLAEELSR